MAPQIFFKRPYVAPIRSGRKTTTVRERTQLQEGDVAQARCVMTDPPFAYLLVRRVEPITLGDLTIRDARANGLASMDAMRAEWKRLYPRVPWRNSKRVYRIHFKRVRAPRRCTR
jgi:hypothetical protein